MNKSFVLIATTAGGELIRSSQKVIAESANRETLENLRLSRAKERKAYLATHSLPWWVMESVISSEEIQEVESV
jgi:hypothetical protein